MSAPTLKVGDVVWVQAGHRNGASYEARVTAIGRKWVTLADNRGRFRLDTWVPACQSWAQEYAVSVFPSRAVYEQVAERDAAWAALWRVVNHPLKLRGHLTAADIRRAIAILSPEEAA